MKQTLALRRWWIAGATAGLVVVRVASAAAFRLLGRDPADLGSGIAAALTAIDVLCLVLAIMSIVAFVQYGRLYRTRVPTE